MASITIDVTNTDEEESVTIKQLYHNPAEGNVEASTTVIVLEPGAGTAVVLVDQSLMVVRKNDVEDLPIKTATAHRAGETVTTVETPEE